VQVDAVVIAMLFAVESPEVSSLFASFSPTPAVPRRSAEEGASVSINPLERTAHSAGFWSFPTLVVVGRSSPRPLGVKRSVVIAKLGDEQGVCLNLIDHSMFIINAS
jgi:hypothetical protein